METFIYKYLSRHYQVSSSDESSKKIRLIDNYGIYNRSEEKTKDLIYGEKLVVELRGVFDLQEIQAIEFITQWAIKQNRWVDLTWYWAQKELWLPQITRFVARTIQQDLIGVEPMKGPTGKLLYLDYQYSGGTVNVNDKAIDEIKAILLEDNEERFRQSWFGVSSRKKK